MLIFTQILRKLIRYVSMEGRGGDRSTSSTTQATVLCVVMQNSLSYLPQPRNVTNNGCVATRT